MSVETNLDLVYANIKKSVLKANRDIDDVQLVCVTKYVAFEKMKLALDKGITIIGESKTKELNDKFLALESYKVKKHFIGHLQSNKVKYIVDQVDMIHSLDRLSLAKEVNKRFQEKNKVIDVLIEVNIAKEESKAGIFREDIYEFIEKLKEFEYIKVKGLMTMAPFTENENTIRSVFKELKELSQEIKSKDYNWIDMKHLSMGMSNDYMIAIEEGATLVRVGSAIFGDRKY